MVDEEGLDSVQKWSQYFSSNRLATGDIWNTLNENKEKMFLRMKEKGKKNFFFNVRSGMESSPAAIAIFSHRESLETGHVAESRMGVFHDFQMNS